MREPFFITEKETEEWLEPETRDIEMPDGSRRPLTDFRLTWRTLDFVVEYGLFSGPEIAGFAIMASDETGQPFEQTFPDTVAYVASEVTKLSEKLISEFKKFLGRL